FPRGAIAVVTEHEDQALSAVEPIDRRRHARAAFAREQALLGIVRCARGRNARFVGARNLGADGPATAARPRLAAIEASVDENPREPDLERPRFAVRTDVREYLDERVLHHFVGFVGVAQVLVGDARRAMLLHGHALAEAVARLVVAAALDQAANLDCEPRILRERRR